MAWTVLCSPILLQQQPNDSGQYVNTVAVYAVPFDADGNGIPDASGNDVGLTGQTPLLASYRQPSDYWSLLTANIESQLSGLDGYTTGTTYYRVDLPA